MSLVGSRRLTGGFYCLSVIHFASFHSLQRPRKDGL